MENNQQNTILGGLGQLQHDVTISIERKSIFNLILAFAVIIVLFYTAKGIYILLKS